MILRSADEHRERTTRAGLARGQSRRAAGLSCRLNDGAKQKLCRWVKGRGAEEGSDDHLAGADPQKTGQVKGMKNTTLYKEVGSLSSRPPAFAGLSSTKKLGVGP
jgi:hypothetical protein